MQVQLNQLELETAVSQYVASEGINLTGKAVDVKFIAGRGENGITATVMIENSPQLPELPAETMTSEAPAKRKLAVVDLTATTDPDASTPSVESVEETPVVGKAAKAAGGSNLFS